MLYITSLLMLPALIIAFSNWRRGLYVAIVVAMLQDPLRKMTPDQPAYFIVLVGVVFFGAWLGAFLRGLPLSLNRIQGWRQRLSTPSVLFFFLILIQAVASYARFGNFMVPAIGMLSYLTPVFAFAIGYQFAIRSDIWRILRWLRFYLVCTFIMLISVYLQYIGFNWRVLGEVGIGLSITDKANTLIAHSGFFRASEIAAWHTATAVCFLFLVGTNGRFNFRRVLVAIILAVFLTGIGLLTGRRKMLMEISVFFISYFFLIALLRRTSRKLAMILLFFGMLTYFAIVGLMAPDVGDLKYEMNRYHLYFDRGKTVVEAIPDRIYNLGFQPVMWAVDQFGFLGAGLGVGSQGTQHFGGGAEVFGGAGEGGLGKITMELGLPGLILSLWVTVIMARYIWKILLTVSQRSQRVASLSYGLIAFLVANLAAFSVATQAYGDLFILIFIGLIFGFFLATPILAERDAQENKKQTAVMPGFKSTLPFP